MRIVEPTTIPVSELDTIGRRHPFTIGAARPIGGFVCFSSSDSARAAYDDSILVDGLSRVTINGAHECVHNQ